MQSTELRLWRDIYLKEVIRGVVHQHDESSSTYVVYTPGEADKKDGRYMVDNLLLEVLKKWHRKTYFSCRSEHFENVCLCVAYFKQV